MIHISNLNKRYFTVDGEITALDNVSLDIAGGEFIAIIGKSGSGKTTLLNMIAGLDNPDSGSIMLNNADVTKMTGKQTAVLRRREIGVIYQFYNLIPELNIVENITLPTELDGSPIDSEWLAEILKIVGLSGRENAYPTALSGGQQQRAAIARALFSKPSLILADEPTGNLDNENSAEVMKLLKAMNEEQNLEWLPLTLLFAAAALIGIFLILLCNYMPELRLKRKSVIQAVKKQNNNASEETHGYRQSKTFRSQSLTKRLAQKSIDYHGKVYSRIMLLFASSAVYPLLAVLLLWNISRESVVVDANPYDGIDTFAPVLEIVGGLLWFLIGCFAVLTCVGFVQAMLIARIQIAERRRSANVYRMIGMVQKDINHMIRKELYGVAVRTLVLLIFVVVILNACFAMIGG